MNSGSSLNKYAPKAWDFSKEAPWRKVSNTEGLLYVATAMTGKDPTVFSHLRIRCNLGMSDASGARLNRIKRFFKALQTYKKCVALDLAHCQISDHTCRNYMDQMLKTNKFITSLRLDNNAFTDEGAQIVFVSMIQGKVTDLNLAHNNLTSATIDHGLSLIKTDKFTKLNFSHTEIGAQGIKLIAPVIKGLKNLNTFAIENCKIGDEGCVELAKAFVKTGTEVTSVTTLNVAENHIGRIGIDKLVENFVPDANTTLTDLDVSRNYFGDEGFGKIYEMMRLNETMSTLKVNKVGMTLAKFKEFCEMMTTRYSQEYGPYPDLQTFAVSNNGLGDFSSELLTMLKHKNCIIEKLQYDTNEVSDFGTKLLKDWFSEKYKDKKADIKDVYNGLDQDLANIVKKNNERRKDFKCLTLKGNLITDEGSENLHDIIKAKKTLKELDLRKNNIGVKGAIWFKKAFRYLQCSRQDYTCVKETFKFHILTDDITMEGYNHLAIGAREHPFTLKAFLEDKKHQRIEANVDGQLQWIHKNKKREYIRSKELQTLYDVTLGIEREEVWNGEGRAPEVTGIKVDTKQPRKLFKAFYDKKEKVDPTKYHLGTFDSEFAEFNTTKNYPKFKRGVVFQGQNDESEDCWGCVMDATYTSSYVKVNDRNVFVWNKDVFNYIKQGAGCVIANTLYRHSVLMRLKYFAQSEEYIRDLYLYRYGTKDLISTIKNIDKVNKDSLMARLVVDDIKEFWETLMYQTSKESEGLTMFEFVLKYADSPVIDVVRQFINVFPSQAFAKQNNAFRPPVFLLQRIGHSGKTYKDLCLASHDKFVRRYARAKKLIFFRFLEVEPVYISKFVRISKVEDLLLTEEYKDEERFFYMRRIAATSEQSDDNLGKNEFDAHRSFMDTEGKYLDNKLLYSTSKAENVILKNENSSFDADFIPQISQLFHRKQMLNDDVLMPTFTKLYKTNLREVLDNESLAGGRDLTRAQIMLRMVASSLIHFNDRKWATHAKNGHSLTKKPRCHGNVKPRNIILRSEDELPNLDKADGYMPGKWVLSDFTRSTPHGDEYYPAADSGYNPPEVAKRLMASTERHVKKRAEASEKIDVWQFGCVLFEVLSGTTLFKMEGNNDLIVDEKERGELVNWLALDDERADLILKQLKTRRSQKSNHLALSLNQWGTYTEEEIENLIASGKELVQKCLQGRPEDRPSFEDILNHPFLTKVTVGRKIKERDVEFIQENMVFDKESWSNATFLKRQPHVHLINTEFEEAGIVVKSIEETLSRVGCRLTTDSVRNVSPEEYDSLVKEHVESARIVACILTKGCFFKPNVVKQLLFAENTRAKSDKPHGRILFIDLNGQIDLSKNDLTWNKQEVARKWDHTDQFQYLARALGEQKVSLSEFSLNDVNNEDQYDTWNDFLKNRFVRMVTSYINDPISYESNKFLQQPMVDRMLLDGHLVPTKNLSKYKGASMGKKNYIDDQDILNKKLTDRKDKFMNLYFLPSHKSKTGTIRTYILCTKKGEDEMFNAVSALSRALEAPTSINKVDKKNRHKEESDPRNKLFSKIKTSYNMKKDSHLKVKGRIRNITVAKDFLMNVSREEGQLLIVLYVSSGVFKKYKNFIAEAAEKREDDLSFVLIKGCGVTIESLYDEIDNNVPEKLRTKFKNKNAYIPYYKDSWQHEALVTKVQEEAVYAIKNPTPKELFA